MKIAFAIVLYTALFLWLAELKINFSPFRISFGSLSFALGWLFMAIGIICFMYYSYNLGNNNGYNEAIQDLKQKVAEKLKEQGE